MNIRNFLLLTGLLPALKSQPAEKLSTVKVKYCEVPDIYSVEGV